MPPIAELKQKAGAEFKRAADFYNEHKGADDTLSAEDETAFNAIFEEATKSDKAYIDAAAKVGKSETVRERLDFYAGKATGQPIPWSGARTVVGGQFADERKSLGRAYIESDAYLEMRKGGALTSEGTALGNGKRWSSTDGEYKELVTDGGIEVKAPTDVIGSGAGPGGALVLPEYLPGILPLPQRPLTVRDLFSQATTTSDQLSYAKQSAFDSAAAAVAQATSLVTGAKPQSSIAWTRTTSPIEAIATWMAATKRQLADAGQTQGLIDNQLRLMLDLAIEDQLVAGNGTSPNLRGIRNTTGIQTLNLTGSALAGDLANINGIRSSMRLVRTGASRLVPDALVVNPVDSEQLDLTRDTTGAYRFGGPANQDATGQPRPVWGLRRVESEAFPSGTGMVGAFRAGGTVFEREGIAITSSDSHSDFFVRNLVAVLGETRLGFAVFFPSAFVEITFKAWP